MKEVLNAAEAARVIGCRPEEVRFNIEKGIWKFGRVIQPSITGLKTNKYIIITRDLCKYFQISVADIERRIGHERTTEGNTVN